MPPVLVIVALAGCGAPLAGWHRGAHLSRVGRPRASVVANDWRSAAQTSLEEFRKAMVVAIKSEESVEAVVDAFASKGVARDDATTAQAEAMRSELSGFRRARTDALAAPLRASAERRMADLAAYQEAQLASASQLKDELRKALDASAQRGADLTYALESSRDDVAIANSEIAARIAEEGRLRDSLRGAIASGELSAAKVQQLLAENAALEVRAAELEETRAALKEVVEAKLALEDSLEKTQNAEMRLEREVAQLASEKASSEKTSARLLEEVSEARRTIEQIAAEKARSVERCEQLLREADGAQSQIESLLGEKASALAECERLSRLDADKAAKVAALSTQIEDLAASAAEDKARIQDELSAAQSTLAQTRAEAERVARALAETKAAAEQAAVDAERAAAAAVAQANAEAAKALAAAQQAAQSAAEQAAADALASANAAAARSLADAKAAAERAAADALASANAAAARTLADAKAAAEQASAAAVAQANAAASQAIAAAQRSAVVAPSAAPSSAEEDGLKRQMRSLRSTLDAALGEKLALEKMLAEARREALAATAMVEQLSARAESLKSE